MSGSHSLVLLLRSRRQQKQKGRRPNAPHLRHREAPVERMHQAAPDGARTWLVSPLENSRFSDETAAKATQMCCSFRLHKGVAQNLNKNSPIRKSEFSQVSAMSVLRIPNH